MTAPRPERRGFTARWITGIPPNRSQDCPADLMTPCPRRSRDSMLSCTTGRVALPPPPSRVTPDTHPAIDSTPTRHQPWLAPDQVPGTKRRRAVSVPPSRPPHSLRATRQSPVSLFASFAVKRPGKGGPYSLDPLYSSGSIPFRSAAIGHSTTGLQQQAGRLGSPPTTISYARTRPLCAGPVQKGTNLFNHMLMHVNRLAIFWELINCQ